VATPKPERRHYGYGGWSPGPRRALSAAKPFTAPPAAFQYSKNLPLKCMRRTSITPDGPGRANRQPQRAERSTSSKFSQAQFAMPKKSRSASPAKKSAAPMVTADLAIAAFCLWWFAIFLVVRCARAQSVITPQH
jgi:hypothetical protein